MNKNLAFDYRFASEFIREHELEYLQPYVEKAHEMLHQQIGPGREYTGWLHWPQQEIPELDRIKQVAEEVRTKSQVFIVVGIGGSYLGARSALELLNHSFYNQLSIKERQGPEIFFAGQNLSPTYFKHLLDIIKEKEVMINVISKSGTTLEPALAFRLLRSFLEKKYGLDEARKRIIVTTDSSKGILKDIADQEGYTRFVVPGDIGGRYSVLTAVGLLPIAAGGVDIDQMIAGARSAHDLYQAKETGQNPCYRYAAIRNLLYRKGKGVEVLVSYEPAFYFLTEWWKQLFGESEGKEHKGILPVGMNFTTDLHSLGQYVQDGARTLFTTTLWVNKPREQVMINYLDDDPDRLNYLSGRSLHGINQKACEGTMLAHTEGQVPNLKITIPEISPYYYGQLTYFFKKACAISGYLLGVNPFDQPGVETYKKNMIQLLNQKTQGSRPDHK